MAVNPFIWTEAIVEGVPHGEFTERVALALKAGTHVALFGSRGTGKTTFVGELAHELTQEHDPQAPPWELVTIDLRRAISLPAFSGAILEALETHPNRRARRRALSALTRLEAQIGVNLGIVTASVRSGQRPVERDDGEMLFAYLKALTRLADRVVVAFDEFQRLASCPGEPLSIIRSALMGPQNAEKVALLFTGSLRERLQLMLHTSTEPIWDQTLDLELPSIDSAKLTDYLEERFHTTNRPIDEHAVEDIIGLATAHPKRSQHLAWHVWDRAEPHITITREDVTCAFEDLIAQGSPHAIDFERLLDTMLSGDQGDINNARALLLVAAGENPGSQSAIARYGFANHTSAHRAIVRLKELDLITSTLDRWRIVDPLLAAWLRRQNPLAVVRRSLTESRNDSGT